MIALRTVKLSLVDYKAVVTGNELFRAVSVLGQFGVAFFSTLLNDCVNTISVKTRAK